jgi:hypothetical protein
VTEEFRHDSWWTIHAEDFFTAMVRCANGEDPEMVYLEYYVNSDTKKYDGEGNEIT